MDLLYPILAVISESVGKTADKFNYTRNKIRPRELLFLLFSTIIIGLLASLVFIPQSFPILSLGTVGIIAFMIAISFGQNFFDYVGLHTKNLSLREPISNLEPILASFLAYLLFPSERNVKYIVAIFTGVIILYLGSADRKLKLTFDKGIIYLLLGTVCSAILASVYKFGLETIAPLYLLLFRIIGVLVLTQLFFRPNLRSLKKPQIGLGVVSGLIYIAGNLTRLYSIQHLGLNITILILLLGPVVVYIASAVVIKEKVQPKQIVASAALLALIVWATYL